MRLEISLLQKAKTGIHALQGLFIFIAACITIAVFTQDGKTDSRSGWFFGVCFLSIPAIIYLCAVPMWSRAHKFANAYAFAVVDIVYTIFWLSAFAAVAAYNREGIKLGAEEKKIDKGNCTTFKFGTEKKCTLSYSAMSLGIVVFFLFIGTSVISVLYLKKQRQDPTGATGDPWLSGTKAYEPTPGSLEGRGSKDAIWSTDTNEIDGHGGRRSSSESHGGDVRDDHGHHDDDDYALLQGTQTADGQHHPGRPWGAPPPPASGHDRIDTSYRGAAPTYQTPTALSPGDDDISPSVYSPEATRHNRVEFPPVPPAYNGRVGGGYNYSDHDSRR